ncbi:MAG TPA: PKD domain-containing protein, partial [Candidatus Hydrogenedentes bacterium]|nr:PKD domain-containing protein [Candidatus Hydrogenedentota bacterium]
WSWDFGDGSPISTDQAPLHTYSLAGYYDVTLSVTTANGSDSERKNVYVSVSPATNPSAAFSAAPTSGSNPLTVQFTDQSTPGSTAIAGWSWNFGDGTTSTERNPVHTYTSNGSFTVSLTVTPVTGSASTLSKPDFINVAEGTPVAGVIALSVLCGAMVLCASRVTRKRP